MAEAMTLVCDVCGRPDAQPVTFRVNGRNLVKDFCPRHLAGLTEGARAPKRGRRPGSTAARSKTPARKAPARKRAAARKTVKRKPAKKS
jgi:hypothetical protein